MRDEMEQAMRQIQMFGLFAHDAALFLDTHPDDRRAMQHFRQFRQLTEEATVEYEKNFGPVTHASPELGGGRWNWTDGPWPWEV